MGIFSDINEKIYQLKDVQVNFFHKNGYLVVGSLFTEEECDAINLLSRKHADKYFSAILNPDRKFKEIRTVM